MFKKKITNPLYNNSKDDYFAVTRGIAFWVTFYKNNKCSSRDANNIENTWTDDISFKICLTRKIK